MEKCPRLEIKVHFKSRQRSPHQSGYPTYPYLHDEQFLSPGWSYWWYTSNVCKVLVGFKWWKTKDPLAQLVQHEFAKNKGGMGFRDIKIFNAALLAKQSWRLMTEANPLLTIVFKARYFKHSTVLDARRGYAPSYTWRSIWKQSPFCLRVLVGELVMYLW